MNKIKLGHIPSLIFMVIGIAFSTIFNGISIYLLRYITDYGVEKNIDMMLNTGKILLVIAVLVFIAQLITIKLKANYLKNSLLLLKTKYIELLMNQDITQLQKENISKYRSNLINDFDRYEEKYLNSVVTIVEIGLQFIMAVVLVGLIDKLLVVGSLILLVIFAFITNKSSKPIQKHEEKKSNSLEQYTQFVEESLLGFEIIRQHQLEDSRKNDFIKKATQVQIDNYAVDVKSTHVEAFNQFIQMTIIFGGIFASLLFARSHGASLGSIIVVASSFGNIMWPLQQLSPLISQMNGIKKVLENFDHNLNTPTINRPIRIDDFISLSFDNTSLGYEDEDMPILTNVNMQVNKGEKVLIVGVSGAGKSTILKTIRQSIVSKNGEVNVNNSSIFDVDPKDYYRLFSTIDQIGFIFTGTIRQNITLFQDINEDTVSKTLSLFGLADLNLDEQLMNNGSNLSGGQRARLMLARALCLESQIILCDEIFSSLEHDIAHSIEHDILSLNKTIINVSNIIFKDSLDQYDKIYIVEDRTIRLSDSIQEVWERMILSN